MEGRLLRRCPRSLADGASHLRDIFNFKISSIWIFGLLSNLTSAELLTLRSSPVLRRCGIGGIVRVADEAAYLIQFNSIYLYYLNSIIFLDLRLPPAIRPREDERGSPCLSSVLSAHEDVAIFEKTV